MTAAHIMPITPVPRRDGTIGWTYTHHALDNREAGER